MPENTVQSKVYKTIVNVSILFFIGTLVLLAFLCWREGAFESKESLEVFFTRFGSWMIFVFILFQAVQVIIPFLPGPVACTVGIILFGPIGGFFYNYIGVCIGSIAAFLLARRFGRQFVECIYSSEKYGKYFGWTKKGKLFDRLFAVAVFVPLAPDDLLCYVAGLTNMTLSKLVTIILVCKPFTLILYSVCIHMGVDVFF